MTSITSAQLVENEWFRRAVQAGDSEKIGTMIYAG